MTTAGRWRTWILPGTVLLLGFAITAGASLGLETSLDRDRDRRFEAAAERARGTVAGRLQLYTGNLAQLRNWMLLDPSVSRDEFRRFVSLGFDADLYPGVQAVSFAPLVGRSELDAFEQDVQAELSDSGAAADFEVHPRTGRADALVVTFIEPAVGNEEAFGFDLASDPVRLSAIEAARDRGGAVGSGPIGLVQEPGGQVGFVLWSPVYDTGDIPNTAPSRRRHFAGVAAVVFRVGDMFAGALGVDPEVDAEIYDLGPTADPPDGLFDSTTLLLDTDPGSVVTSDGEATGLHRDLDLNIGDRRWRMILTAGPGFTDGTSHLPLVIAILGTLISLLLAGVIGSTTRARGRAESRAVEMTAELRAATDRSQSILAGAPDAMLVVGGDGSIISVNLATEALFGYSSEELVGRPVEVLLPESLAEDHRQHRVRYADAPRRREMGAGLELFARRRDGVAFPVEVSLSPLIGSDGSHEVIAAVRDVSERRQAQAALQAAYDHEREAAEQLREADELKTRFLNTVSHELRTPLTAISGFTELLQAPSLSDEQREEFIRRIRRNSRNLSSLIADLLAFAHLDRDDVNLVPARLDLTEELRLIVEQLSPVLDEHRVEVHAPEPVYVEVDPDALTRIATNLLTNVARYSPKGSTVTVSVEDRGDRAVLAVSDEGPGIPPEERERVFERFFRGATALASRVPGTGIGLAVVSELVARSGGSVRVISSSSGGALFEVELPRSPDLPQHERVPSGTESTE